MVAGYLGSLGILLPGRHASRVQTQNQLGRRARSAHATAGKLLQSSDESGLVEIGEILAIFGFVPLIWGCVQYAKGKGLSPYFGALGLFWIVGLVVLVLLPDKHKTVEAPDA